MYLLQYLVDVGGVALDALLLGAAGGTLLALLLIAEEGLVNVATFACS